jgi:hypothetical protein
MNWRYGSIDRELALKIQSPEFNPQSKKERETEKEGRKEERKEGRKEEKHSEDKKEFLEIKKQKLLNSSASNDGVCLFSQLLRRHRQEDLQFPKRAKDIT